LILSKRKRVGGRMEGSRGRGEGTRSRGPRAFSIKHVRIRCKDVNTRANLLRHLGHGGKRKHETNTKQRYEYDAIRKGNYQIAYLYVCDIDTYTDGAPGTQKKLNQKNSDRVSDTLPRYIRGDPLGEG
jgi:hypothetical protein